jgi:hypothetical protein
MTPEEYGLWDVCRSVSHKTGTLYFDGRTIAGYFSGTGKDVIYRIVKSLVKKGWLLVQVAGRNSRNGLYVPTQYQVLSPEQWTEDHAHDCLASDPEEARVSSRETPTGPVSELPSPVLKPRLVQSGKPEQPVVIPRTASRETPTGPVVIPRTTSLESPTYSAKEISMVCDSAVLNVAEGHTAPSIPVREARQRIANLDGWLAGRLSSILQKKAGTVIVATKDERQKLNALSAQQGHLSVLLAFYHFAERDRTLCGLAYPISMFIGQAEQWIKHAAQERQEHTNGIIETVSIMLEDYEIADDNIWEPLCELAYLESDLNGESHYDPAIVAEYLSLRFGQVEVEPEPVAEVQQ